MPPLRPYARRAVPLALCLLSLAPALSGPLAGQGADTAAVAGLVGFGPAASARERAAERALVAAIQPAELDSFSYALTREPHVAGSASQARTRDWVLARTRAWGLRSEARTYHVFLPWARGASLELLAPERLAFELREQTLAQDSTSGLPQYPWVNAYSAAGVAEGPAVYVNYGLHRDYALLDSAGVEVRGRIVLARYGRAFRGVKARLAEQHGAAGLLLYSDPADDGYVRGDVYPDGPYRNASAAQRGSVLDSDGDPTTPGWPSLPGARHLDPDSLGSVLPRIPVMPISYGVARQILSRLGAQELPDQSWQGGLPFRYHVGPGPAYLRMRVEDDRAGPERGMKDIWDTFAWLPGSEWPDEWVIVGAHRDAWSTGANDNASGVAAVLAAARALAERAAAGEPPRRTIVFATWDAEEWGLIGSVEWVEEMARQLGARAVAYLNQDAVAGGPRFRAAASPALKEWVRDLARAVPAPQGGSLFERWREQAGPGGGDEVAVGNPGGGSDYLWFYGDAGVPAAGWGFGGGSGEYHSAYDSYDFERRFGDPGFLRQTASARLVALAALRLADAAVLPFDYAAAARELRRACLRLRSEAAIAGGQAHLGALFRLDAAFRRMEDAADSLAAVRDGFLAGGADVPAARAPGSDPAGAAAREQEANARLLRVERSLLRPAGPAGLRNLTVAVDPRSGYAAMLLPGVAGALRAGDFPAMVREADELAERVDAASGELRRAAAALGGPDPAPGERGLR